MALGVFKRLQGRHYRKYLKNAEPLVRRINETEESYQKLSNEELRAKTDEFKRRYQENMKPAREEAAQEKDEDKARQILREANQKALNELLPEAYAAVKNAARRLFGQPITLCGQASTWDMIHYDVQLIGGVALHENRIAEMATGEGKTLVATLPLYLNSLTGRNCQLVTTNDYLARRDAEWMGCIYNLLGISVGCIQNDMDPPDRREMYGKDITYGTASEFGFDYLRDNGMATRKEDQVQRDHYFCIVDEVDCILIDEARTPLIISGTVETSTEAPFRQWKSPIDRLVKKQNNLCNKIVAEAKEELRRDDEETRFSALSKLLVVKMGAPKNKQFMRLMEEGDIRKKFDRFDLDMLGDFNKDKRYRLKEELYFSLDEKRHEADLTEKGRDFLRPGDPDAFVLPDLPTIYMEIDKNGALTRLEKDRKKAQAQEQFEKASLEIHTISQLMRAYALFEKDVEYVVQDGKVMIVDEHTGRVMPGRRWSDGLHQAIEAKEGVSIEKESKTYATITIQNYFRLYEKLAGMTGTAETEANEFKDIYGLDVMVIPTHKPNQRTDLNDLIYKTRREKYNAVIEEIKTSHAKGQPVLVGTVSVEASEVLSRMLRRAGIPHSVLNAKHHQQEAEIITRAGQRAAVTISTNMAGRGTDIKLGTGVTDTGGLYVLGTERHTARRIDRQLRGRCARQGDPGLSRFYLSLEDELMRHYSDQTLAGRVLESSFEEGMPLEHKLLNRAIERAQKTVEQHHYSIRKRLLQYDDVLNRQREVVYDIRNDAIHKEAPRETVFQLIEEELDFRMEEAGLYDKNPPEDAHAAFQSWINSHFPVALQAEEVDKLAGKADALRGFILDKIKQAYAMKEAVEDPQALVMLERYVIINAIDQHWRGHLTEMEDLKQSVGLRGYGQKDPLNEYKSEAFAFFEEMMKNIRGEISSGIFRSASNIKAFETMLAMMSRSRASGPSEAPQPAGRPAAAKAGAATAELPKITVRHAGPKPGRNDPCPCGSGKKYKKCCSPQYG